MTDTMREKFERDMNPPSIWQELASWQEAFNDYAKGYQAAQAELDRWKARCIAAENGHPQVKEALADARALVGELLPYKAFFDAVWTAYCNNEIHFDDADFIISEACKNGLAKEERYDETIHGEALGGEWGLEKGDPCYVLSPRSKEALTKAQAFMEGK